MKENSIYLWDKLNDDYLKENRTMYTVLKNKLASNFEFFIIKTSSIKGLMTYYPEKDYEILCDNLNILECLNYLKNLNITYNDVAFLDYVPAIDYILITCFFKYFTTLATIVMDSRNRSLKKSFFGKKKKEIEECWNGKNEYQLSFLEEFILNQDLKLLDEIKSDAKEQNILLKFNCDEVKSS